MLRIAVLPALASLALVPALLGPGAVPAAATSQGIPGLAAPAQVIIDSDGVTHINAQSEHDLVLAQGWLHARDRLFQMDVDRRTASGTLAELLGKSALAGDINLRTVGLRRAAERSWPLLTPATQAALQAYADGVNAWVDAHLPPAEYGLLEIATFPPWTPIDTLSLLKLAAFGLSYELDLDATDRLLAYQEAGAAGGFDGTALFFEDLHRSAPFDPAATIPDAGGRPPFRRRPAGASAPAIERSTAWIRPATRELLRRGLDRLRRTPLAAGSDREDRGSNEWVISGALVAGGWPLLANDPHLGLKSPALYHLDHLRSLAAGIDAIGGGRPGVPYIAAGHNARVATGATTDSLDVTDVYQEILVPDPQSPSGLSTLYQGAREPVLSLPQLFRYNLPADGVDDDLVTAPPGGFVDGTFIPPAVLIVPRRNQGPLLEIDLEAGVGISVQWSGSSGSREADAQRFVSRVRSLDDARRAAQLVDSAPLNIAYADVEGRVAYLTTGEVPLREDLEAGRVAGLEPAFLRDGTGGNEWLPATDPPPDQALPYQILPFAEMPQLVDPPAGWFVNANNDPVGTTLDNDPLNELRPTGGIYYLARTFNLGTRAGRISRALKDLLGAGSPLTRADMQALQADTALPDAEVFTPWILAAFAHGQEPGVDPVLAALAADPGVAEAVGRLAAWDHTSPTGVVEGYDAADVDGQRLEPDAAEVAASIGATLYSVWRGRFIAGTIDATLAPFGLREISGQDALKALRNLLDHFDERGGVGASGLDFFAYPGVDDPPTRRDIHLLASLRDALDLLAAGPFADAFDRSADQDDYRWGRLHRLVLDHPLGPPFSMPPAGGAVPPSFPDLPGLAIDGGVGTVDAAQHNWRAERTGQLMFNAGPVQRFLAGPAGAPPVMAGETSLPGGASGILGNPLYANLLGRWLTNDTIPLRQRPPTSAETAEQLELLPAAVAGTGPGPAAGPLPAPHRTP